MPWLSSIRPRQAEALDPSVPDGVVVTRGGGPEETWRRRWGFEIRLLLTLALTLLLVGALGYVVTSRETEKRLIDEATTQARGDLVFIQQAFESGTDTQGRVREMNSRLRAINNRPGRAARHLGRSVRCRRSRRATTRRSAHTPAAPSCAPSCLRARPTRR